MKVNALKERLCHLSSNILYQILARPQAVVRVPGVESHQIRLNFEEHNRKHRVEL